jgi:hypothetical protein
VGLDALGFLVVNGSKGKVAFLARGSGKVPQGAVLDFLGLANDV